MSKLNLSVFLNTYSDSKPSNSPNLSNFKWARDISGINANNAQSQNFTIAAGATVTLFTGSSIKKIVYLETNQETTMVSNGTITEVIKPIVINNSVFPGIVLKTSDITSIVVTNNGTEEATIFLATVE